MTGIWYSRESRRCGRSASLAYRIEVPSGVQPATATDGSAWKVRRRAAPPATGITYTSGGPSSRPTKASIDPSGDSLGWLASATPAVSRTAWPPSAGATHRSSSQTKTTVSR